MNDIAFTISYEIRSPERGSSLKKYMLQLAPLMTFQPSFVSIANHQPEEKYAKEINGDLKKSIPDKYPSTYFFAIALKERFGVEVIPHLLCNELEPESIDDILLGFHYVGIEKIMALRGDRISNIVKFHKRYNYSSELIKHIDEFNRNYHTTFDIGIAGYPDLHPTAISAEHDLFILKTKIGLGATFVITQMFLDNQRFYDFLKRCGQEDVTVPIYPGLKLIQHPSNLVQYRTRFNLVIPENLELIFSNLPKKDNIEFGEQWLFQQCDNLINNGQRHLHFYVFSEYDMKGVFTIIKRLKGQYPGLPLS